MDKFAVFLVILGLISLIFSAAITPWASIVLVLDFAIMMLYSKQLSKKSDGDYDNSSVN